MATWVGRQRAERGGPVYLGTGCMGGMGEVLIRKMNNSPTDIIIFLRDMETFPVAATVSGISFVNSIVFSTNSSNREI